MDNAPPSRTSGRLPVPTDRNVSFVICSIDDEKFAYISRRIYETCTSNHEILRISKAKDFTIGVAQARFETIVLCHDDIDILCQTALSDVLHNGLKEFDLIGAAGPTTLKTTLWLNGGPSDRAGLLLHGPVGKADAPFSITCYGTDNTLHTEVQALDGVFIATKKKVFERVRFDSSTFDDVYFYDIDFTYRCHRAGLRLGVVKELLLVQESPPNPYGKGWQQYEKRFREKFPELGAAHFPPQSIPVGIKAASLAEAVARCSNPNYLQNPTLGGSDSLPTACTDDERYTLSLSGTATREIDAQLPAEHTALKWNQHPGIHLLMALHPGEESLLADTLDSLATQAYPEWLLTIVTGITAPEGLSEIHNIQWLALRDIAHINYVIDEMAAASPGTWLARIAPGLTLEPQALQVVADYVHAKPEWRLIYCDEDTHETDGIYTRPLFKPDLNLDLLRSQAYFGSFVLVEKKTFLSAGRYGEHGGAENDNLALRILDLSGEASIGHLDQMLAHLPRGSRPAMQPTAQQHDQIGPQTLAAAWSNLCAAATSQSCSAIHVSASNGHLPPPANRSVSFVICSIDNTKYAYVSARLDAICTAPHEIIRIDDARSLSEGYTRGIAKARFDTVVLCHDDIDLLCDTALADILHSALHEFDVVGVAGPRVLKSAFWLNGGPANTVGLVVHGPVGKPDAPFVVNYYDCSDATQIPVQALDGVFIAAKKRVFDSVGFDADIFDGFHLYDIDFSYRCHLAGLRVGVAKDLALVHASPGNFGETWLRYEKRFREKFPALAPARLSPCQAPAAIYATSLAEATLVCRNPDTLLDIPSEPHLQASPIDQTYSLWLRRRTLQEIDAQLLAERMVLQWKTRPGIHLLLAVHPGEENLLADTLDSLAAQLYPEWLLTIVTALPTPEGLGDTPNIQWLALRDAAHIDYVIDEMAAASPGTWLTRIDPGLTLEPQALQVVADYINEKPDWRLIYCDEDTLEADGSFTQPLFKPDFNLDLLRAQAYFGCFIVVAKQAFLAAGRYGDKTGAENYDLSLRILDQNGESSIGHIDQMLAHLPRNSQRAMQPEAEKLAVTDHLARCGLDTAVLDGALFGTRRIQYKWATTPKVSIIIPTRDREEYLRPLLESLFERTRYPNYEVIILDNDSRDPDTVRYLAGLVATEQKQRTRVIAFPGEFSWSGCANAGAEAAEGDYLLFLDNDIHIVQDDWLARLMSIAQRPEVAIVAPRLTYPETGRVQQGGSILGLYGTVGSPWDNQLELSDPGYMGRALCDQNVSAASGSALLVRRSAYVQLGGFDTTHFGLVHGALDLCLRAGDVGHKIVFTPHSALVHYGSISITARQRKLEGRLADLLAAQSANETLIHRWMPRLVHDPAYNRNLSLLEPYKPEHVAPTDWDLHFHDRPRILAIPVPGGAGEYRLRAPLRIVGQAGLAQTMICESPKAFAMRILSPVEIARAAPDALVLHQPLDDSQSDAIENYARYLPKVRRILTIDDLVTDLPKKHPLYKSGYKDGRQRLRRNLALMDRLVVSTRPLADLCVDMIEDIRVMPNCLEWAVWGDAVPPRLPRKKPRVGWAGAQQHQGDLELIYPVVEALADEVDWIFMGMCPPALKPFVHESHGFEIDFSAYPKALARLDLDLAIAPLDIHPFNEAKSNLRLLEYGAMGWPVICTDIYPYQNAPVTRLPNEPETWIKTIREQLAEPEALREAGLTLQAWVHDSFILENHAPSWFAAYGP